MKTLTQWLAPAARWLHRLARWGAQDRDLRFVERPPRSHRPGRRTRVLWNANQIHPYAFTIEEPDFESDWPAD